MDFGLSDAMADCCESLSRWVGAGQAAGIWKQFVMPIREQLSLACGLSGLTSDCCADHVLGVYARVQSRSLGCELQVSRHMGASVLQRLRERN